MSAPKIPYTRRWTTQPKFLEGGELLCDVYVQDTGAINVVEAGGCIYVTIGGLFGQQTVKVPSTREALAVIHMANNRKSNKPASLPEGWELCEEERDAISARAS